MTSEPLARPEMDLLRRLVERSRPLSLNEIDANALAELERRGLVARLGDLVLANNAARAVAAQADAAAKPAPKEAPPAEEPGEEPELSDRQAEVLRNLVRSGSVPAEDLDGRVLRGLNARGLIEQDGARVRPTEAGTRFYERNLRRRRRAHGTTPTGDPRRERAEAIREAVRLLEQSAPGEELITIGEDGRCTASQALAALRELADRIEAGGDPRKPSR